ncbi:MAG: GDP-mannose 4,6-dehydratase [Firmicutes bacterium]|nr:GDP-mannose 4,6-dehydratase [Bacillota bacterium]
MKVLVAGITGLVGSYIAEYLLEHEPKAQIFGTYRWRSRMDHINNFKTKVTLMDCDIRDAVSVRRLIRDIQPDILFHMASQSSVFTSWHAPRETLNTNIIGEVNFFEALREYAPECKILIPGSSEEYGLMEESELPADEHTLYRPLSPYAVSKVVQDMAAYQYQMSYHLNIYRARSFNHTGPRREVNFVESNFARQIAMIEKGKQEPVIQVGNLEAKRDYTDVRDMVKAYWLMIKKCPPGEVFNICSGRVVSIRQILDILLGLSNVETKVQEDSSRFRPYDAPAIYGDCSKFKKVTGWEPEIPLEKTLEDILNYWRQKV